MSIARSLKRRDGMEIERGVELAKIYYERIEEFFKTYPGLRRLNIVYEEAVEKPEEHVRRIIDFLGIKPSESQYREALSFILSPQEKEKLVRRMKRKQLIKQLIKKIIKGITHPWRIPRFIWRKLIHS